jgi:hypothetical protein
MSDDGELFFWSFVGFSAGIWTFFRGFREFRKYRVLVDTPEIPIRSVPMGLVEIYGVARGGQQIFSPVSHTPCFYYKVEIEKWTKDSDGRGGWSHHLTDQTGVSFYLQDTTGRVLIEPQEAELDLNRNARRETGGGFKRDFVSMFGGGKKTDSALGIGPSESELLNYIASVGTGLSRPELVPASPTEVSATSGTTSSGSSSLQDTRAQFHAFLREYRRRGRAARARGDLSSFLNFIRSGLGTSGRPVASGERFRLTEYCIVPDRPYDITGTCTENPMPKDPNDRNMIVKGKNEPTFVISWRSEREIESHLRRRAIKYIFGGAILAVVCAAILLGHFG